MESEEHKRTSRKKTKNDLPTHLSGLWKGKCVPHPEFIPEVPIVPFKVTLCLCVIDNVPSQSHSRSWHFCVRIRQRSVIYSVFSGIFLFYVIVVLKKLGYLEEGTLRISFLTIPTFLILQQKVKI